MERRLGGLLAGVAFLACSAGSTLGTPSADATPTWLPPVSLSEQRFEIEAYGDQVALDSHGDALAVWVQAYTNGPEIVESAFRPAGGSWQDPVALSEEDGRAGGPQVAFDAHGDAVATWLDESGGADLAEAASRPAGGSWQPPVNISDGVSGSGAELAVDPAGDAVAVWGRGSVIKSAFMPSGGSWEPPVNLTEEAFSAYVHARISQVVFDSRGDATAIWTRDNNGAQNVVQASTKPAGGSWQPPVNVSDGGGNTREPRLALDAQGDAVAVWEREDSTGHGLVQASTKPAGGDWQPLPLVDLSQEAGEEDSGEATVAMDPSGDVLAAWARRSGPKEAIETAYKPFGGNWQPTVIIQEHSNEFEPQVTFNTQGEALLIWVDDGAPEAALRQPQGSWQSAVDVSPPGQFAYQPHAAFDADGDAVATWDRETASLRPEVIDAAGYASAGPQLNDLSIPSTGTTGAAVSFTVSPLSVWSTVAETRWHFGDGTSATGTSPTHTYAKAGTYEVTVESEDALGNETRSSGSIMIAPRIERPEYKGWLVSGSLSLRQLGQAVDLPAGSTFDGSGELNTETGVGSVRGNLAVPPFTANLKLFGLLPINLGMTLTQTASVQGSATRDEAEPADETLSLPTKLDLGVGSIGLLGLSISTNCASTEPIALELAANLTEEELLLSGWSFSGSTTVPRFKCGGGFLGGLFGQVLTALLSGPGDTYSIGIKSRSV